MLAQENNNTTLEVMLALSDITKNTVKDLLDEKEWVVPYIKTESFTHLDVIKDGEKVFIYNHNKNKAKLIHEFPTDNEEVQLTQLEDYENSLYMFLENILCSISTYTEGISDTMVSTKQFYKKFASKVYSDIITSCLYNYSPNISLSFGKNDVIYITHEALNHFPKEFSTKEDYTSSKVFFNSKLLNLSEEEQESYMESNIKSFKNLYDFAINTYLKKSLIEEPAESVQRKLHHKFKTIVTPTSAKGYENVQMVYKNEYTETNIMTFNVNPLIEYRLQYDPDFFDKFVLRYITAYNNVLKVNNNRPFVLGAFNHFRIALDDAFEGVDFDNYIVSNNLTEDDYMSIYKTICDSFDYCKTFKFKSEYSDFVSTNPFVRIVTDTVVYMDFYGDTKSYENLRIINLFKPEIVENKYFVDSFYFDENKQFITLNALNEKNGKLGYWFEARIKGVY